MLHPTGTVLHNPVTAEWGRVLHADADLHVAELITAPGGGVPVMHRHHRQTEQFDVLAGELTVKLDGARHVFGPGETATVSRGAAHCWTSTGAEPLYARVVVSPSLHFQEMISATWGLCALGRARGDGAPGTARRDLDGQALQRGHGALLAASMAPKGCRCRAGAGDRCDRPGRRQSGRAPRGRRRPRTLAGPGGLTATGKRVRAGRRTLTDSEDVISMFKRVILIATITSVLAPAAATTAKSPLVSYRGKTKGGTKISFVLNHGWVDQLDTLLPTTCISVQGGTPKVDLTLWRIPFKFKLGYSSNLKYGDPTTYYTITTRRLGARIVGKLSMNYSLLGSDAFGNYMIWHCLATAKFDLRPH